MEGYWGLHQRIIPQEKIGYPTQLLFDGQTINAQGIHLIYYKEDEGYRIVTDDPGDYLTNEQLLYNWKE